MEHLAFSRVFSPSSLVRGIGLLVLCVYQPCLGHAQIAIEEEVPPATIELKWDDLSLDQKKLFIYHYLLADIAWRRGNINIAADSMAQAANVSGELQIVTKAYSYALQAERGDVALQMAELASSLDRNSLQSKAMLLRAYIVLEQPDAVYKILITMLTQPDANADLVIRYVAEALGNLPDPGKWLSVIQQVVAYIPARATAHLAHGFVAYKSGDFEQAEAALLEALVLDPGWEEAAIYRLSWWSDNDNRESTVFFGEEFLFSHPDRGRFRFMFAQLLYEWGIDNRALYHFSELVNREPGNQDAILRSGLILFKDGSYELAKEMFERLLALNSNSDQSRLYLAYIAKHQGYYRIAIDWLLGISAERYYFEAQLEVGRVLAEQGQIDDALGHLANIVPDSLGQQVRIYLTEEYLLRHDNRIEQALDLLNAALIDIPDDPDLLYARGLILAQMGLLADHERDMRRLMLVEPNNAHAYNALGYTLADKSIRLDEALALIMRADELKPNDPFILDSLGWVYYRMKRYDLAIYNLRRAFDLREDPEIAAHLGEALWAQGLVKEARSIWRKGQSYDGGTDNLVLGDTIERLDP